MYKNGDATQMIKQSPEVKGRQKCKVFVDDLRIKHVAVFCNHMSTDSSFNRRHSTRTGNSVPSLQTGRVTRGCTDPGIGSGPCPYAFQGSDVIFIEAHVGLASDPRA